MAETQVVPTHGAGSVSTDLRGIRQYHGGTLNQLSGSLWATPDADYAAAVAQLYEAVLWILTLDVSQDEWLDLMDCGLDVAAVVRNLRFAGIPANIQSGDDWHRPTCGAVSQTTRSAPQAIA